MQSNRESKEEIQWQGTEIGALVESGDMCRFELCVLSMKGL